MKRVGTSLHRQWWLLQHFLEPQLAVIRRTTVIQLSESLVILDLMPRGVAKLFTILRPLVEHGSQK